MRLFDASVWAGRWPFRPVAMDVEALERHLVAHGIGGACVASAAAVLSPEPMACNAELLRTIADRRGEFEWAAAAVIDPTLADWHRDADAALSLGARAFKLLPNYHMYALVPDGTVLGDAEWIPRAAEAGQRAVQALCDMAADHGVAVAVQLRMQDERTHHPLMKVPAVPARELAALAARHRRTTFLACAAATGELAAIAPAENVMVETSFVESRETLADAVRRIPAGRWLFGSHSPLLYTLPARAKLDAEAGDGATVPASALAAVARENARRIFA